MRVPRARHPAQALSARYPAGPINAPNVGTLRFVPAPPRPAGRLIQVRVDAGIMANRRFPGIESTFETRSI